MVPYHKKYHPPHPCQCDFRESKLFCIANSDEIVLENEENFPLWVTLASLELCLEECSPVLHEVTGVISALIVPESDPTPETVVLDVRFRIIDELGKEVCQRRITFAQDITPPNSADTDVPIQLNLPFNFQCCDRPRPCECKVGYRLQVEGLNSSQFPFIRDVVWSAIVWENNCGKSFANHP